MIRYCILAFALFFCQPLAFGQHRGRVILQEKGKRPVYYIDVTPAAAYVFHMGIYYSKFGEGPSIRKTDTLFRQPDNSYRNNTVKLTYDKGKSMLIVRERKTKQVQVDTVRNLNAAFTELNHALFLTAYLAMCDRLDAVYPLHYHSRWSAMEGWHNMHEKEFDYQEFKAVAAKYFRHIEDSISRQDAQRTALTNYLLEGIKTMNYNTFRDSLVKLPVTSSADQKYFSTVVKQVAAENPDYYFRLAEDLPDKDVLFWVIYDKKLIRQLKLVPGHDAVKKDFMKHQRQDTLFKYYAVGMNAILAGLVVWLIVR